MGDRWWGKKEMRRAFLGQLSMADHAYLLEYLGEHKIPPGTLSVDELKRILEDCKGAKKMAKGVKDGH